MSARRRFPPMLIFLTCVSARESRAWSERKREKSGRATPKGLNHVLCPEGGTSAKKREKKSLIVEGGRANAAP